MEPEMKARLQAEFLHVALRHVSKDRTALTPDGMEYVNGVIECAYNAGFAEGGRDGRALNRIAAALERQAAVSEAAHAAQEARHTAWDAARGDDMNQRSEG